MLEYDRIDISIVIFYQHQYHNVCKNLYTLQIYHLVIDRPLCMIYHRFQKTYFLDPFLYIQEKKNFL